VTLFILGGAIRQLPGARYSRSSPNIGMASTLISLGRLDDRRPNALVYTIAA
jgi:hypothetical protein